MLKNPCMQQAFHNIFTFPSVVKNEPRTNYIHLKHWSLRKSEKEITYYFLKHVPFLIVLSMLHLGM